MTGRWGLVVAVTAMAGSARADQAAPPPAPPETAQPAAPAPIVATTTTPKRDDPDALNHAGQIGVTARVSTGMRFISTYNASTSCDANGGRACFAREPTALELELAYGLDKHIDLLAEFDLGLEQDFSSAPQIAGPHIVRLSPGFRVFFAQDHHLRGFATVQAVFDFSDYKDSGGMSLGNDFGVRSIDAFVYDINRSVGVYIYAGETFMFDRWFDLELEAGLGVQLRYP
jgi:hypothetical protein